MKEFQKLPKSTTIFLVNLSEIQWIQRSVQVGLLFKGLNDDIIIDVFYENEISICLLSL